MSLIVARKKRTALYLSIIGLVVMAAAVMAVSARDPGGVSVRAGMVIAVAGAAMFLPVYELAAVVILMWLLPDGASAALGGPKLFSLDMLLELPGLIGLGAFAAFARESLRQLELELLIAGADREVGGLNSKTGVLQESRLMPDLAAELARSRRFGRSFALVLVGIDPMRQRYDYRDEETWDASLKATTELLRGTRNNVDRVYQYGNAGYALLLPESGEKDVKGLVRRLRRTARKSKPSEGEPGGPFAVHYGATFFPACATSAEDLVRRAEIAMRIAEKSPDHLKIDTATAAEMAPVESLRRRYAEEDEGPGGTSSSPEPQARQLHVLSEDDPDALEAQGEGSLPGDAAADGKPVEAAVNVEPPLAPVIDISRALLNAALTPASESRPSSGPESAPPSGESSTAVAGTGGSIAAAAISQMEPGQSEAPKEPASFEDGISGLLAQLDETLDMIRTMKSSAA